MWYADQSFTPEEIQVLKELEYDLFMYNPGFRSMWNNNFTDYFKSLFDENAWNERQEQSMNRWESNVEQDPEFRSFLQRQSLIDEVLLGELDIKNVPLDVQREIEEIRRESKEVDESVQFYERLGVNPYEGGEEEEDEDELFTKATMWRQSITKVFPDFYEETKNIDAFRILKNFGEVPAKIYAAPEEGEDEEVDFEWRIDRINYTLALTCLNRCVESMENLRIFPQLESTINTSVVLAKEIRQELIDRLENIQQSRLSKVQK